MARKRAGTLWIPTRLDFRRFRKELREDLPKEAREGGQKAAKEMVGGLRGEFNRSLGAARDQFTKGLIDEAQFRKQSQKAAKTLLDGLRAEFNRTMGRAREQLARNLISRDDFRRLTQLARRDFNAGILPVLKDMQKAGQQNTEEYTTLSRALKNVGTTGRRAGQETAQGMSLARRATEGLKSMALGAVTAFAGLFALGRLRALAQETVDTAREARLEATRQEAVWERNAGHVGRSLAEIQRFSRQMQRATLFKDGEIDLAISQLLTYKSISGDAFERTIKLGGDMAAVFGGIERSTMALARALDDPIRGLGDLRKQGYTFDDAVVAQVRSLTEQNRLFEAQRILLTELEKEVSGTAAAMKTGWVAVLDDAGKLWQRIRERIGEVVAVPLATTVVDIADAFHRLVDPLGNATEKMERFGVAAESLVVTQLATRINELKDQIAKLEREAASATIVSAATGAVGQHGGAATGSTVTRIGGLSPAELSRRRADAERRLEAQHERLNKAILDRNATEERGARITIENVMREIQAIDGVIEKREQVVRLTEELLQVEEELGEAREKSSIRRQISEIDRQIKAIENLGTESVGTIQVLERLQAQRAKLEEQLAGKSTQAPHGYLTEVARIEAAFEARMTNLRERLARELINKEQFEEQGREAAAAFNRGILSIIDQGGLTEEQRVELVDLLKDADGDKALAERRQLVEQLTDDVARLTETATQTALRELGKLEEKFRETFGGSIPAAAQEGLAKIRENIELGGVLEGFREEYRAIQEMQPSPEALASMQALVARVREQRDAIDESHVRWKEFDALIQEVEKRAKAGEAEALVAPFKASFNQEMAKLREQLARGLIDRKEFERAGREAGKVLRDAILAEIEKLRASGALSDEVYQALVGALPGEADPAKDDAERLRSLRDQARAIEEGARAALQLADAFGIVDERVASALQNVVQVGTSLSRIIGGDLTAIPSAIAGAASLIKGLVGDSAEASRERVRQVEEMVRLREALEKLRHAVLTDVTAAERERMVSGGAGILEAGRREGLWWLLNADAQLRTVAQRTGMSKEDALALIREIEGATGAPIWSDRGIDLDALEKALGQLPELGLFTDDLMGQLDGLDWLLRTLGDDAGTAAEQLDRFLAVLRSAGAEGFADEFQRILDEQGAAAAQAWLNSLAEGVAAREQSLFGVGGIFEGLTAEEARRLIERSGGFLTGSGLVASGAETRMNVNLTQTQGDELLRIGSTQLYHLAGIHSLIAQMVSAPPPSFGALPSISPPSPASLGLGGVQQMMTDLSGMTVEVHVAGEGITPGNAHDVGQRIGAGIGAGLNDRLRQGYRASGVSGPVRVEVS